MDDREIGEISWGLPDDWVHWVHGRVDDVAAEIAALGEDTDTAAAVMAAAVAFEAHIASEIAGTSFAAMWVPTPGRREPLASGTFRVATALPSGRMEACDLTQFVSEAARRAKGARVVDLSAAPTRVVAGDAVLRIVDRATRFRRQVTREWSWFILPPGTSETVVCQFESDAAAHFDEIADMTTDIANAVRVETSDVR